MTGKLPTQAELNEQTAEAAYQRLLKGERVAMEDLRGGAMAVLQEKIAAGEHSTLHMNGNGKNLWYTLSFDPAVRTGDFGDGKQGPAEPEQQSGAPEARHYSEYSRRELDVILTGNDLKKPPGDMKGIPLGLADDEDPATQGARLARMREVDPSMVDAVMRKYIEDNHGEIHLANMTLEERDTYREALIEEWKLENDPAEGEKIMDRINNFGRMAHEGRRYLEEALLYGTEQFRAEMQGKYPEAMADIEKPAGHKMDLDEMDPTELLTELDKAAPPPAAPKP